MRRYWLAAALGVLVVAAGAYRAFDNWHFRYECEIALRDVARGRYESARNQLARLAERRPGDGEVRYQLGVCEERRGNSDAALKAWARVPDSSPFAGRAAVSRARAELQHHRFAPAEELMRKALGDRGAHALEALETLVSLYKIQGRFEEARRLVRGSADRYPDRIGVLKELALLDSTNPYRIDRIRTALETASQAAPDDDRVWLGWANLATRTSQIEEAARWLDRCQGVRPDDAAVWRARLNLARASEDQGAASQALSKLPAEAVGPAEVLDLRAWFAAKAGDDTQERAALTELVTFEPANLRALERLAELELRVGNSETAARLRERRAALERDKARYDHILFLPEASAHIAELARLAEALDRPQEARLLWLVAHAQRLDDREASEALARLEHASRRAAPSDARLSALLAELGTRPLPARTKTPLGQRWAAASFVDDAETAGLRFTFDNGIEPLHQLPETMSGGVALFDFDGDGWLDVYCVQGGPFPPDPKKTAGGDRLFHNRGDGTFEDVSEASGISALSKGYGHGVAVGDYDNDGHPDLFVTRWRSYALYHNKGDGTFEDATVPAGLGGDRDWPTSAAFADLDNDGDLDLFVCHYLVWDAEHPEPCWDPIKQAYVFCGPPKFHSRPDHLFRNDGGRFVDVTEAAGIVDTHGQGLGVVACDYDNDGWVDLFVANDQSANFLFRNMGGMRFEEVGQTSGVAASAEGKYQANMGVACGDPDGDGRPDLAVTTFYNEGTTLYHNLGNGVFADHSAAAGLLIATRYKLGFGAAFLDFNSDGNLDLAVTNGHVDDLRPRDPYMMPSQLLAGTPEHKFVDISDRSGAPWQVIRLGRGMAIGDVDNDGKVDLLILSQNQPLAYFHNRTDGGHWLSLRLEGTNSNRDAVGAVVKVTAGGRKSTGWRFGGGSYQSAGDSRLHFGLGEGRKAEEIEVTWPSGRVDRYAPVEAGTGYLLREGEASARPLTGYAR